MTVVIDSGSKFNIVDKNAWDYLKANKVIVSTQRKVVDQNFKAYGGFTLNAIGVFQTTIETPFKCCKADFYVLENFGKILIGYKTGVPLGVMKIGENVNHVVRNTKVLGKIKGFKIDIPIDENVKPVAQPYRRVPVPLEEAVDRKVEELWESGIIEKVN